MAGVRLVYHLAALVDHYAEPGLLHKVNVKGSVYTIEAAIRNGVERFVHCSSVSAEPGGGSTTYGQSKILAEKQLKQYQAHIPMVIIRPGPVYDEGRKNIRRLVDFCKKSCVAPRLTPDTTVHLAGMQNVIDALLLAGTRGRSGQAYAICDREPVKRSVLSRIIAEETGARQTVFPLSLFYPFLYGTAFLFEGLYSLARVRPLINRHYLRVLTRERRYDIRNTREELGLEPVTTEDHFRESVKKCLSVS